MEVIGGRCPLDTQQLLQLPQRHLFCLCERRVIDRDWSAFDFASQVVRNCGGSDKVTVNASLQQRVSSQPVCTVIGKIGFAQRIEPWNRRRELVVHPQTTHRKVRRR